MALTEHQERPDVELRLPADGAWVHVVRTTTAGLAARLDFTIDDIEDLRIAVGEACALVLDAAVPASDLDCGFFLGRGRMTISVGVVTEEATGPDRDSFAWQVLSTLASSAEAETVAGRCTVRVTMESDLATPDGGATGR